MADQTVAAFVAKLAKDEKLRDQLEDADLAELLAIAKEHDLRFGAADELYAHAKHSMELWGTAPGSEAPQQAPSAKVSAFLSQAKANPDLRAQLEEANLEELLALARRYELDMGHADALYSAAKSELEIW
jgi:hypothetical protein